MLDCVIASRYRGANVIPKGNVNMAARMYRSQCLLILLLLSIPILLNVVSMWQEYGQDALREGCIVVGSLYIPWPGLFRYFLVATAPLGLLACLTMFVTTKYVLKNHLTHFKYVILLVLTLLTACASGLATLLIDIQWSSMLRDGVGPGFTVSHFVDRNILVAFLTTVFVMLYGFWLSRNNAFTAVIASR